MSRPISGSGWAWKKEIKELNKFKELKYGQ
jgi:hypothetical protein